MIREISFNHTTEDGETVRALAAFEEPDYSCGIQGGWFVDTVEIMGDDTNALLYREQAEKRFGIREVERMDQAAADLDQQSYDSRMSEKEDYLRESR